MKIIHMDNKKLKVIHEIEHCLINRVPNSDYAFLSTNIHLGTENIIMLGFGGSLALR